jgi:uncharacterized protein
MKLLVLLAVLVIAYLVWRNARVHRRDAGTRRPDAPAAGPVEMVSCPECGVHLPKTDALPGPDGRFYCCNEHRLRGGG